MNNFQRNIFYEWELDARFRLRDIERDRRWQRFRSTLGIIGSALVALAFAFFIMIFWE